MIKRRITAFIVAVSALLGMLPVFAETSVTPQLYIDDTPVALEHPCVVEGDEVYIPFEEVFFKMGVYMNYDEESDSWKGMGNNGEIVIEMDKMTAQVDLVDIELPYSTKKIDGVPMVPMYFIEDGLKTDPAVYDKASNSIRIKFPDINDRYVASADSKTVDLEKVDKTLPAGEEMWKDEYYDSFIKENGKDYFNMELVKIDDMHFDKAVQLETLPYIDGRLPNADYDIQPYVTNTSGDFLAGETGILTFWARALKATDETGYAKCRPCFEQSDLYNKAYSATCEDIGFEWKKYYFPIYNGNYSLYKNKSRFTFPIGYKPQIIQIADIHVRNFHYDVPVEQINPESIQVLDYHGIEDDAVWRKEAWRRIEKYRKNDMLIHVTDENGNPIEGAEVKADMTNSEFNWGFMILPREILHADPDSRVGSYRIETPKMFNLGEDGYGMKYSNSDYINEIAMYKYFYDQGLRMRGHAFTYDTIKLKEQPNYADMTYEEKYDTLIREVSKEAWLFRGMCREWDVLNEPTSENTFRYNYGTEVFSRAFQVVSALDPTTRRVLNENSIGGKRKLTDYSKADFIAEFAEKLRNEERAPIEAIGTQEHCGTYNYPQLYYKDLERIARDVDSISVTEYDWTNKANAGREAEHMRDKIIGLYSHPKATTFVMWGYSSSMHWVSNAPFFDMDWNKKEPYYEWERLVNGELTTHETVKTDKDGNAVIRGHRGDYDITVTIDGGKPLSAVTQFCLVNSEDTERDNRIEVRTDGKKLTFSHSNPTERYEKHTVLYRSGEEAYADYLRQTEDREFIGIFSHKDNSGESTRNTTDGLVNTFWYGGNGDYMEYELVENADKGDVTVTFRAPQGEVYDYKVLKSKDGKAWTEIYSGKSDVDRTIGFEDAMFIRVVSDGNEYMGISEVTLNAEKKKI